MAEFLSLEEAAVRLGITESTLRNWVKRGTARVTRRAGADWFREREVERLLEEFPRNGDSPSREVSSSSDNLAVVRVPPPPPPPPSSTPEIGEDSGGFLTSRRERLLPRSIELPGSGERQAVPLPTPVPRSETEELKRELEAMRERAESAEVRERGLEERLRSREREVVELQRHLEASVAEDRLDEMEARLYESDKIIEHLRAEERRLREEAAESEALREKSFAELENLRIDMNRLRAERDRLRAGQSSLNELEKQVEDAIRDRDSLQSTLEKLEQESQRNAERALKESESARILQVRVSELEEELTFTKTSLRQLEVEYASLKGQVTELDELESLREDVRTLQKTALKLETERSRLINDSASLRGESEDARKRLQEAEERRMRAEEELKAMKGRFLEELRQVEERYARAQARVETLESHMQSVEKRQEDRAVATQEENRRLKEELKNLQLRLQSEPVPVANLEDTRALMNRVADLESAMEEKDRSVEQAFRDRSELRNQLEAYKQHYYELQQRYEREKSEWSNLVAHEFQRRGNESQMQQQAPPEPKPAAKPKGWGLFRPRSDT